MSVQGRKMLGSGLCLLAEAKATVPRVSQTRGTTLDPLIRRKPTLKLGSGKNDRLLKSGAGGYIELSLGGGDETPPSTIDGWELEAVRVSVPA